MNKKNFDTILAQAKKYFKLSCSGDSACLNQLTTKVTGFTVARLDREAAADPASQVRVATVPSVSCICDRTFQSIVC